MERDICYGAMVLVSDWNESWKVYCSAVDYQHRRCWKDVCLVSVTKIRWRLLANARQLPDGGQFGTPLAG